MLGLLNLLFNDARLSDFTLHFGFISNGRFRNNLVVFFLDDIRIERELSWLCWWGNNRSGWLDRRVSLEPRMLEDLFQADSFLRVSLQELCNQIFRNSGETFWPFDFKLQDVFKEFILV